MTARCSQCAAPILWTMTEGNGRLMPVDLEPVENGNVVATGRQRPSPQGRMVPEMRVLSDLELTLDLEIEETVKCAKYVCHFATCSHGKAAT